jgi:predicted Zn-dependent protease
MRIDTARLSAIALEKCLRSRNPFVVEPGRYTLIMEPQAVSGLVSVLFEPAEYPYLFHDKLGKRVMDERVTFSQDPLDADVDIFPFTPEGEPVRQTTWIDKGIVRAVPYDRTYAVTKLGKEAGQPLSGGIRMSGGESSVEEMIASTKRGLLVTRFSDINLVDKPSALLTGYTRDGVWLVENGKITKPVKNLRFTESPLFALNNLEQLGTPVRVDGDFVVPPIKVHDFSFTALTDAI